MVQDAGTDGHAEGRDEGEGGGEEEFVGEGDVGGGKGGEADAEGEAFEALVEDYDDEEDYVEGIAGDG